MNEMKALCHCCQSCESSGVGELTLKIGLWRDKEVLDLQERVRGRGSPGLLVMRGGRILGKMGGVRGLLGAPAMSPWTSHP